MSGNKKLSEASNKEIIILFVACIIMLIVSVGLLGYGGFKATQIGLEGTMVWATGMLWIPMGGMTAISLFKKRITGEDESSLVFITSAMAAASFVFFLTA